MKKLGVLFSFLLSFNISHSQSIVYTLESDSIIYGNIGPGQLIVHGDIENLSGSAMNIEIERIENNLAPGWQAAFCVNACQPPNVNYVQSNIPADSSLEFCYRFYPDVAADTSDGLMRFTQMGPGGTVIYQRFVGITIDGFVSVQTQTLPFDKASVYPSALSSSQTLNVLIPRDIFCYESANHFEVFDMNGKKVYETTLDEGEFHQISVSDWGKGIFIYKVSGVATRRSQVGRIVIY